MKLLTAAASNAKTAKLADLYEAAIMHFAPAATADGLHTVCAWSTAGCRGACLNTAGRGQIKGALVDGVLPGKIHAARRARTLWFLRDRRGFLAQLYRELRNLQLRADKRGKRAVVRLNGTSDIPWETIAPELLAAFPEMQFYDYTKSKHRALSFGAGELRIGRPWPYNYHLTYSRSENDTPQACIGMQLMGVGVAVVFADGETALRRAGEFMPRYETQDGRRTLALAVDGLAHDWRFTDPRGALVILTAKGRAKRDTTGFVVR